MIRGETMVEERQKRLIELYEKGVLTKEEAKACFMELEKEPDFLFVEEKTRLTFSLPNLKIFYVLHEIQWLKSLHHLNTIL